MRLALQIISLLALAATVAPSILFLSGAMGLAAMKATMLAGTILWFFTTPWWMD